MKGQKIPQTNEFSCPAYFLGKLITKSLLTKVETQSPMFLECVHDNIYGPIHPPCGPFRYFIMLIDVSSKWSHVCLLST